MTEGGEFFVQVTPVQLQKVEREEFDFAQVDRESIGSRMEDLKLRRMSESDSVSEAEEEVRMSREEKSKSWKERVAETMENAGSFMKSAGLFFIFLV